MTNLVGISGSLRAESSNTRLLEAARLLKPPHVNLELVRTLGELPHFSPDQPVESSPLVTSLVDVIRAADGIVVSSPVYAGGYPGTLKNALDWLVGTDAWIEKPFMMLSASSRMPAAQETLVTVLTTMSGVHVAEASMTLPLLGSDLTAREIAGNAAFSSAISEALNRFIERVAVRPG